MKYWSTMLFASILLAFYISAIYKVEVKAQKQNVPIARTKYGLVEGDTGTSRLGRSFLLFKGIPYAAPPVGNLRFKV